jgi:NADH-quinone oxidoreductase subunit N
MGIIADTMTAPSIAWRDLIPFFVLLGTTCGLILFGSLLPKWPRGAYAAVSVAGSAATVVAAFVKWHRLATTSASVVMQGAVAMDRFAMFGIVIVCIAVALASILTSSYMNREGGDSPEIYALFLIAAIGAIVMLQANDLIVLFLGLEVLSLPLYLMAASNRRREQSQEAGLKYFILGGFSSAFFLYGIALIYGAVGSTDLNKITTTLSGQISYLHADALLLVGVGMLLVGLAFKVAAVPFHVWAPDVYEGSPSPVTAFMASIGKVAAFGAILRLFVSALAVRGDDWRPVVWALAIITVFVGSIMAVQQTNVKRMLAFSSVTHAGFILIGVEAAAHKGGTGVASAMTYLFAYTFLVIGSFAVVTVVAGQGDGATGLDDFRGLAKRRPALALGFSALLFAQAGVPFTSGFIAKFGVIKSAVEVHSYALAIAAMVAAVIGAFLYLRIMVSMWMDEPTSSDEIAVPFGAGLVVAIAVGMTLLIGVYPGWLLAATKSITGFAG